MTNQCALQRLLRPAWLALACAAFVLWAAGSMVPAAAAGDRPVLTAEEMGRMMQAVNALRSVDGQGVQARWFADGETFWYSGPGGSFHVDPEKKERRKLEREEQESWSAERPRRSEGRVFSPDFSRHVTVEDGNLHFFETGGAKGKPLTDDAGEDIAWSAAPEGWSPDGSRLLALRTDLRSVHHLPIIDYTDAEETVRTVVYGKSGGTFARFELALFDLESGKKTVVEAGTFEDVYLFIVGWSDGGDEALFLRLTRDAKRLDFMAANPETGASRCIVTEERETFVGGLDFITRGWRRFYTPLEGTSRFLWLSERDGWRHIYLYDLDGTMERRLTEGEFPVLEIIGADLDAERVFFMANGEKRLYDTHLYSVGFDGRGFSRLTEGEGDHEVQLAPSMKCFVDTYSTPVQPPVTELRGAEGELLLALGAKTDIAPLEAAGWTPPEEFVVKADDGETDLYGILYKPHDFDELKKYPVIDIIYAGPFTTVVPHTFSPGSSLALQAQMLAQVGFVTFIVDCRGTIERGKAFQDASFGRIGQIEIPDHVAALRQIAADRPFMDLERVGVTGASWGGYFALRAMLTAPDVFRVGIASAPGDLTESPPINEPYMGLPRDNPEGYAAGSNPALAAKLAGRLLIIHGTADVNAPFSTSMRMADALIRAGRLFDLAVLPQADHYFRGHFQRFRAELMISYFREHL